MKHLTLITALVLVASPAFGALSTWADPYGRTFTPSSSWNTSATQGVFAGVAPRAADAAGSEPAPAPGPVMSLSITPAGLLDFVFQQLYASFDAATAERIRAVLAPQYTAMALQLQGAFGGAEIVGFPEGTPGVPAAAGSGGGGTPPAKEAPVGAKAVTFSGVVVPASPAVPASSVAPEPLSVTQSMAVVAATSLLMEPGPTLGGVSSNTLLLAGDVVTVPFDGTLDTPEPGTLGLIGAGLVVVWLRRRS